jgi:hypothetical protein
MTVVIEIAGPNCLPTRSGIGAHGSRSAIALSLFGSQAICCPVAGLMAGARCVGISAPTRQRRWRRAIRNVGARLVFLPKYSPDLNPIEQVFAKFKTLQRKAGARSYEAVSQACAQILTQYRPEECAAYIRNAGYA